MGSAFEQQGHQHERERRIRVRAVRLDHPDLRRLARVLIEFAQAEAEAAARAEHQENQRIEGRGAPPGPTRKPKTGPKPKTAPPTHRAGGKPHDRGERP